MEPSPHQQVRTSSSNPSLRPISNRTGSVRSTGSRSGAFRHSLLRANYPIHQAIEKDLPVPPILTADSTPQTPGRDLTRNSRSQSVSVPQRKSSKANLLLQQQEDLINTIAQRPAITLDSTIASESTYERASRRPSISAAEASESAGNSGLVEKEIIHERKGSAPKVSSSPVLYTGEAHSHHSYIRIPKVQPFSGPTLQQASDHGLHSNHIHDGHTWVEKVQPYHTLYSAAHATTENSIPRLAVQSEDRSSPSKVASYWGFLPMFKDKKEHDETNSNGNQTSPDVVGEPSENPSAIESTFAADASPIYQKNPGGVNEKDSHETTLAETAKNVFDQKDRNPKLMLEKLALQKEKLDPIERVGDNGDSEAFSPTSISPPKQSSDEQSKHEAMTDKLDPRRTATWLRQLLGYSGSNKTQLTQLPSKLHPRHEPHEDYPAVERSSLASRVSTFSRENAADAGAINDAMRNLEELLTEALLIANEAAEHDDHGHVDDGNLRHSSEETPRGLPEPPQAPSVHESLRCSSTESSTDEEQGPVLAKTPPIVFVGAVEGTAHGCEALPLRAVRRQGLAAPDMRSGNITAPMISNRKSSARGLRKPLNKPPASREVRLHVSSNDDSILPMPPPDYRLRKKGASSTPHAYDEDEPAGIINLRTKDVPNSREVREYIRVFHQPPISLRASSTKLREASNLEKEGIRHRRSSRFTAHRRTEVDVCSLDGGSSDDVIDFSTQYNGEIRNSNFPNTRRSAHKQGDKKLETRTSAPGRHRVGGRMERRHHETGNIINLQRRSHVSLREGQKINLARSVKHHPIIARDWSPMRKRFVASVACISTALIGILVGIYAGLVPSIQYYIADFHHYSIIGNVALYLGMALSTFFCWPLPLLHGRKPYIVCSLCIAMPLLFPQAIAVSVPRSPYTSVWRWALLLPRGLMGCALGFASMNFHSMLTDLFGASLMSGNPHQEVVDEHDVRRHGGGLGVWLGVWTWCFIGSLGLGFLIGALVIDVLQPSWGLYISVILIAVVLLLNVLCPEVRRSGWRRSVAEVRTGEKVSRRVARGEIMMHRVKDGPVWWGQEVYHGAALSLEMLRQPGFLVVAVYSAWIYAQIVLIIVLLGSLTSKFYRYRSPYVGAAVSSVAIGALLAVPFQKANIFSRARHRAPLTNKMTLDQHMSWTSHLDCSDLQPGMTGRRKSDKDDTKRTNYSSFPRVTAGANTIHSIGFIFAAVATGIGGMATRNLGQREATGVVAGILLILSLLLLSVLARFWKAQIIPNSKNEEMEKWTQERRDSLRRRESLIAAAKAEGRKDAWNIPEDDVGWRPIILGNPAEKHRRLSILEMGSLTRWNEIRKKNRLIDENVRLNREAVTVAREHIEQHGSEIMEHMQQSAERFGHVVRQVSVRSLRSLRSRDSTEDTQAQIEVEDLNPVERGTPHRHSPLPPDVYRERECVMGQTVHEEAGEMSSMDGGSDEDYGRNRAPSQDSHIISVVHPDQRFEQQQVSGRRLSVSDYVVDVDSPRREHASHGHGTSKVKPADPNGAEHREQHGSHMHETKVKSADIGFDNLDHQHGHHMQESKVQAADLEFHNLAEEHGAHMHESKVKPAAAAADEGFEDVDLEEKEKDKDKKKASRWHFHGGGFGKE
ncbi:hypothetical protein F4778DRAFT_778243 [Xylariomycetidae sp. FL2044]|nr:hypothetical protein F4778DRAFT_778243 [Xylariomycetidae sp. FL2044]